MTSARAQALIDDYAFNTWLIHDHIDGITDDESLLQPPFQANCLNWILGHIVWRRNSVLEALGLAPLWDEEVSALYMSGSSPLADQPGARRFADLVSDLDQTLSALSAAIASLPDAGLNEVVENDRGAKRVIEHLQGFHWHETYHIGQLDILGAFSKASGQ